MSEAARSADTMTDAFADLVCADPLLLRAEFDALIAASWDSEPPTPPTGARTLVGVLDPGPPPGRGHVARDHAGRPCAWTSGPMSGRLRAEAEVSTAWDPSNPDGSHDAV
jgi:hypothetical protein